LLSVFGKQAKKKLGGVPKYSGVVQASETFARKCFNIMPDLIEFGAAVWKCTEDRHSLFCKDMRRNVL
jgi:hypothetical protein